MTFTKSAVTRYVASDKEPREREMAIERYRARAAAVAGMLTSVGTFVIVAVALLFALSAVGINIAPLLASAGIAGIAIGFGAQTIVRDFLSGVFMILENQYGVGDVVTVNGITGTVEDVGLRITRMRDFDGTRLVRHQRLGDRARQPQPRVVGGCRRRPGRARRRSRARQGGAPRHRHGAAAGSSVERADPAGRADRGCRVDHARHR